jgi:hypothetical protein
MLFGCLLGAPPAVLATMAGPPEVAAAAAQTGDVQIEVIQGNVDWCPADSSSCRGVTSGQRGQVGDRVVTYSGSRARLHFPDQSVQTIGPNRSVTVCC